MPKLAKFDEFFTYANFFYGTIGVEPYTFSGLSCLRTFLTSLIFYANFLNLHFVLGCEIIYVAMSLGNGRNVLESIMAMAYIGFVIVGSFKTIIVWRKKTDITEFVQAMRNIFPESVEEQQRYRLLHHMQECKRLSKMLSAIFVIGVWIFNLVAITQYLMESQVQGDLHARQELPYYMYTMWEWQNHWSYYPLYVMQSLAGHTSGVGIFSSDLLLCSLVAQLVIHFHYVARTVASYEVKLGGRNTMPREKAQALDLAFLRGIIKYHSYLLDLSERLNQIFGLPLLINFGSSSLVICFVGFQLTIGASFLSLFKFSLFLVVMLSQAGLVCHYGQLLLDASVNVAEAVYNQNWSNADVRYQKMLALMAKRAQKPAQLKATAFLHISRATMTELIQLSYKFFALLRTMYVQK